MDQFVYGYLSGMAGIIVSHPFDTLKTNIQENKPIPRTLRGLYSGIGPPMIGVGLEKSVVFGVYYNTIKYTDSPFISGALSGLSASFVVTPFERIKILLQTSQKIERSMFHRSFLFQGLSATLYRETPGFGIYFSTYQYLKDTYLTYKNETRETEHILSQDMAESFHESCILHAENTGVYNYFCLQHNCCFDECTTEINKHFCWQHNCCSDECTTKVNKQDIVVPETELLPLESFTFGAIAGAFSWVFIYPQDRIKTHLQSIKDRKVGFMEGFREVLKNGGYRGLYRGFHFALMRAMPLHATVFATMDLCQKYIKL
jgi:hypothetical protein